jgi:acetate kinase
MSDTNEPRGGILVVNTGSSSLQFAAYRPGTPPAALLTGPVAFRVIPTDKRR